MSRTRRGERDEGEAWRCEDKGRLGEGACAVLEDWLRCRGCT